MKNNISDDTHIYRYQNGIVLARANEKHDKQMLFYHDIQHTIKSIKKLPCNIYFSNLIHRYQLVNDNCAESCGFDSPKNALNKTILDTATLESASIILNNNDDVLKNNKMKIIEEELFLHDGAIEQGISIKLPWYNLQNKIIGLFGMTIIFGRQKIDKLLSHIVEIGLLNQNKYLNSLDSNQFYLSSREKEIIYWIERKKTAKEIGNHLKISHRTIEKHIENIKSKLNVKSRDDIINKIIRQ